MKSLMAHWYSEHLRDMKCTVDDLEVVGSKPGWFELGVCDMFV